MIRSTWTPPGYVHFEHGMTVAQLKELVRDWPETREDGTPTEVWVSYDHPETGEAVSFRVGKACDDETLDHQDGTASADFLLLD
jgi:hypothetical protein